ncbi:MAG: CARDB domain-containing protein [candidate division Zixibacteria bacterium]|nr:CARDB domain-containing protein [candidate division Zixibacteria bacterium]
MHSNEASNSPQTCATWAGFDEPVIPFTDRFEDATVGNWIAINNSISVSDDQAAGSLYSMQFNPGSTYEIVAVRSGFTAADGEYSGNFMVANQRGDVGFRFQYQNSSNYYEVAVNPLGTDNPTYEIAAIVDGTREILAGPKSPIVSRHEWFSIDVARNTSTGLILAVVNSIDTLIAYDQRITDRGTLAIRTWVNSSVDNLKVYADNITFGKTAKLPDLTCHNLSFQPVNPYEGQNVIVTATVENRGDTAVGEFYINLVDDTSNAIIGTTTVQGLPAGGQTTVTFDWTVGFCQVYSLTAIVDPSDLIVEDNDLNNTLSYQLQPICNSGLSVLLNPPQLTAGVGDTVQVEITIINNNPKTTTVDLNITGLPDGWATMEQTQIWLMAGGIKTTSLKIVTPDECTGIGGTYYYQVKANSSDAGFSSISQCILIVDTHPVIVGLLPINGQVMGSNDVSIIWSTLTDATVEVFYRVTNDIEFHSVTATSGIQHEALLTDLTRNTRYEWFVQVADECSVSQSEIRSFTVDNGIVFTNKPYHFNIERDYGQVKQITVMNEDEVPHTVLVEAINEYSDLVVGFIGSGSIDETLYLEAGQTADIDFAIHAQDTRLRDYNLTFRLLCDEDTEEPIVDYASALVHINNPDIRFHFEEVAFDSSTMVRTLRLVNDGDLISDLKIDVTEMSNVFMLIEPNINHARLAKGTSITFQVIPSFDTESSKSSINQDDCSATLTASAAGNSIIYPLRDCCSKDIYVTTIDNVIVCQNNHKDWYCTNRNTIQIYLNSLRPVSSQKADFNEEVNLSLDFSIPPGWQARPHDVNIAVNGHSVGRLENMIPDGNYNFEVDPAFLNYSESGPVTDVVELSTVHMNGGHYVISTGARMCECKVQYTEWLCSESLDDAVQILLNRPYLHEAPNTLQLTIESPANGSTFLSHEPVTVEAFVADQDGAAYDGATVTLSACDGQSIQLGNAGNGRYSGQWSPSTCPVPNCDLTVSANACGVSQQTTTTVVLECTNLKIYHIMSLMPEWSNPSEIMQGGTLHRYYRITELDNHTVPVSGLRLFTADGQSYESNQDGVLEIFIDPDYFDALGWTFTGQFGWNNYDHAELNGERVTLDRAPSFTVKIVPMTWTKKYDLIPSLTISPGVDAGGLGISALSLSRRGTLGLGLSYNLKRVLDNSPYNIGMLGRRLEMGFGGSLRLAKFSIPPGPIGVRAGDLGELSSDVTYVGNQVFSYDQPFTDDDQVLCQTSILCEPIILVIKNTFTPTFAWFVNTLIEHVLSLQNLNNTILNSTDVMGLGYDGQLDLTLGPEGDFIFENFWKNRISFSCPTTTTKFGLKYYTEWYTHSIFSDQHIGHGVGIGLEGYFSHEMTNLQRSIYAAFTEDDNHKAIAIINTLPLTDWQFGVMSTFKATYSENGSLNDVKLGITFDNTEINDISTTHNLATTSFTIQGNTVNTIVDESLNMVKIATSPAPELFLGHDPLINDFVKSLSTTVKEVANAKISFERTTALVTVTEPKILIDLNLLIFHGSIGGKFKWTESLEYTDKTGSIKGLVFGTAYTEASYNSSPVDNLGFGEIMTTLIEQSINIIMDRLKDRVEVLKEILASIGETVLQTSGNFINGGAQVIIASETAIKQYYGELAKFDPRIYLQSSPGSNNILPYKTWAKYPGTLTKTDLKKNLLTPLTGVGNAYNFQILDSSETVVNVYNKSVICKIVVTDSDLVWAGFSPDDRIKLQLLHWDDDSCFAILLPSTIIGDTVVGNIDRGGQYFTGIMELPQDSIPPLIDSTNIEDNSLLENYFDPIIIYASDTTLNASGIDFGSIITLIDGDTVMPFITASDIYHAMITISPYPDSLWSEGNHSISLYISDNNGNKTIFTLTFFAGQQVHPTNEWISLYCDFVQIDNSLPVQGSLIQAFDPDEVLCGEDTVRTKGSFGFMPVYRDDIYSDEDEGAEPGDTISFRINSTPVITNPPVIWTENGARIEVCQFFTERCLDIRLKNGWNLISWNVQYSPQIDEFIEPIQDCVDMIVSFDRGGLTYDPDLELFSTLNNLDYYHGYWIKTNCDTTITICGDLINQNDILNLYKGWNLISYWPDMSYLPVYALVSIENTLVQVLGYSDSLAVYKPDWSFNTLNMMKPGLGYWVQVNDHDILNYPGFSTFREPYTQNLADVTIQKPFPTRNWISIYGEKNTIDGSEIVEGSNIEIHTSKGTLCGQSNYQKGILKFTPVYGYDETSDETKLYPKEKDTVFIYVNGVKTTSVIIWQSNTNLIKISTLYAQSEPEDIIPEKFSLYQNYPNPFNPYTEIGFDLPSPCNVKLEIFNIMGQKVATLIDKNLEAGHHTLQWDASNQASGVYFYKITAGDIVETKKMVLLK